VILTGEKKVFVLGDSLTGTTTVHKFLKLIGYNSIHYFFTESGVTELCNAFEVVTDRRVRERSKLILDQRYPACDCTESAECR